MTENIIEDLAQLSSHGHQLWLLGAGASVESNLPLVSGLTKRVCTILGDKSFAEEFHRGTMIGHLIEGLRSDIGPHATIEDILDHLADHLSIARRSSGRTAPMRVLPPKGAPETEEFTYLELQAVHQEILKTIRDTLRWGYVHSDNPGESLEGTPENPILRIDHHESFIEVLFGILRAGRELRVRPIEFFTTNYDTLIEDALALQAVPYSDGFCGGAVAHWDQSTIDGSDSYHENLGARVTKIHGSIDWTRVGTRVLRRRISDLYPEGQEDLLIYPQALKYELTKREPFDSLFAQFRAALNRASPQVLFVCGYGFGDEHIDQEIYLALSREDSQLTLVRFSQKNDGCPSHWQTEYFGERVYVVTEDGIWRGTQGPFKQPPDGTPHNWWTFTGMTTFLRNPEDHT